MADGSDDGFDVARSTDNGPHIDRKGIFMHIIAYYTPMRHYHVIAEVISTYVGGCCSSFIYRSSSLFILSFVSCFLFLFLGVEVCI